MGETTVDERQLEKGHERKSRTWWAMKNKMMTHIPAAL